MSTQDDPATTESNRVSAEEDAQAAGNDGIAKSRCEDCGGALVTHGETSRAQYNETYCESCGLVHQVDALDRSARVRLTADGTADRQRGPASDSAYANSGLGTKAPDPGQKSGLSRHPVVVEREGGTVLRAMRSQHETAARLTEMTVILEGQGKGRALRRGLAEVRRLCSCLELPWYVRDDAGAYVQTASENDLLPGHNVDDIAAAAVYIAAYIGSVARPYDAVARHAHCNADDLRDEHRHLAGNLSLQRNTPDPADFVAWYVSDLKYGLGCGGSDVPHARLTTLAQQLLAQVGNHSGFANRAPTTRVGAAIYVAGDRLGLDIPQHAIADVVGVTVGTIGNAYPAIEEATGGGD